MKYLYLLLSVLMTSCTGLFHRWDEASQKEVKIIRYDEVVDDFVSLNSYSALQRLNSEYSLQTSMLIENVLAIGNVQDKGIDRKLRAFYQDSLQQRLYSEVRRQYESLEEEEKQLTKVFSALKDADSSFVIPAVYAQVCALHESILISDSVIGVGLDKYLGTDYPLYKDYYYDYQRRSMNRSRMVPDILLYYLIDYYGDQDNTDLLHRMILLGKIHWVIAHLLDKPLSDQINFYGNRRLWCVQHEHGVWQWMKQGNLLHTFELVRIMDLLMPRDHTPYFGPQSSDQLGLWVGAQIVDSYMKHNKGASWKMLLHTDSETIYQKSGYNP